MLYAGTRNEELAGRVGGVNGRNTGTNHDGLLMEVAVAKVAKYMSTELYLSVRGNLSVRATVNTRQTGPM